MAFIPILMTYQALQMLTGDEVSRLLNVHRNQITMYRETGILKGTKTGKNIMYSQKEIMEFQDKFKGYDISNKFKVMETLERIKNKEIFENE